ncbi:MAG: LacI family DNA-binding transcriptional regulator [Lachnospiraceae bacterium]|nr:LacI family DNA-binding transcriptional regulator [Lachnospiraceae bacterium]
MGITAKELAEKLGISRSTISMVYNNKKGISEETRTMVKQAAQKYGYQHVQRNRMYEYPSVIQYVIFVKHGNVVSDTAFFANLLQGIDYESKQLGYVLHITYFYCHENAREQMKAILDTHPTGLLLLATEMEPEDMVPFKESKLPLVVLDSYVDADGSDCITINNVQGAYHATSHLIRSGHINIGYLSSKVPIKNFEERSMGFHMAISEHDAKSPIHSMVVKIGSTSETAYEDMCRYLDTNPTLPTAFFADNDIIASSCIKALKEYGYKIPEQISIIGFDDMPFCNLIDPPLTSMRVPKQMFGQRAVSMLDQQIHGASADHIKMEISTTLVNRNSVAVRK